MNHLVLTNECKLNESSITGYLAVEALDDDDEMSQICIFCGIIPEVVLGVAFHISFFL